MKTLILQGLQDLAGITGINNHYYFNLNSQAQSKPTRSPQKMRKHLAGVISIFDLRSLEFAQGGLMILDVRLRKSYI